MTTLTSNQWIALEVEAQKRLHGAAPAHDYSHVQRVVRYACIIGEAEGADLGACRAAALLHELFNYPKDHPESSKSGDICAEHAKALLTENGATLSFADHVSGAIRDHAFSKGALPSTLTARILQDADRLDAIGAIGVARCLATCSEMRRPFYAPVDPFCRDRQPNDKLWGIDHFYRKLLQIPERLHTRTARDLAAPRAAFLERFLSEMRRELDAE